MAGTTKMDLEGKKGMALMSVMLFMVSLLAITGVYMASIVYRNEVTTGYCYSAQLHYLAESGMIYFRGKYSLDQSRELYPSMPGSTEMLKDLTPAGDKTTLTYRIVSGDSLTITASADYKGKRKTLKCTLDTDDDLVDMYLAESAYDPPDLKVSLRELPCIKWE
ncbi:MAG: hypothetical protein HQL30_08160 [Candidatus Omnitrophica bacterium]|nr:hypothetical protein [Candidatus Omnitrophota bacterium]